MRILLINPSFEYYSRYFQVLEPLSLAYLAAYLRKQGYVVNILDAVAGKITKLNNGRWRYGLNELEAIDRIKEGGYPFRWRCFQGPEAYCCPRTISL